MAVTVPGGSSGRPAGSRRRNSRRGGLSSLYHNALYLILNSAVISVLGFVFWNLMARKYPPATVGIGSALIAASWLIASLANLGLGNGLVRFVPEAGDKGGQLVNSVFWATGLLAALASAVYMAGLPVWSPALGFLTGNYLFGLGFLVTTAASTVFILSESAFVARRSAKYVLWKNLITSLTKIPLSTYVFFVLGGYGIFLGNGLAIVLATTIALWIYLPKAYPGPAGGPDLSLVRPVLPFSISNYLASLLASAIGSVFQLMVLNLRGAENNAYFYMAWLIAATINLVPAGVATSLLAECSHRPQDLGRQVKRALWLSLSVLAVAVGILYLSAGWLLGFFGSAYAAHGTAALRWLLAANFPIVVNSLYNTVNQVKKKMACIVFQAFATSALDIGLGYWLLGKMGLAGIGVAHTLSNTVVALVVATPLWRAVTKPVVPDVVFGDASEASPGRWTD